MPVRVPAAPLPSCLPAEIASKAEESALSVGASVTHGGDQNGVAGCWFFKINLYERLSYKEGETEAERAFHSLVHLPNGGDTIQSWATPKPEAFGPSSASFSGH